MRAMPPWGIRIDVVETLEIVRIFDVPNSDSGVPPGRFAIAVWCRRRADDGKTAAAPTRGRPCKGSTLQKMVVG